MGKRIIMNQGMNEGMGKRMDNGMENGIKKHFFSIIFLGIW